jgi:hypothetical protein
MKSVYFELPKKSVEWLSVSRETLCSMELVRPYYICVFYMVVVMGVSKIILCIIFVSPVTTLLSSSL